MLKRVTGHSPSLLNSVKEKKRLPPGLKLMKKYFPKRKIFLEVKEAQRFEIAATQQKDRTGP